MGNWVEPRVNALVPCYRDECVFIYLQNNKSYEKDMNYLFGLQRGKECCDLPNLEK
jgi:hypothetical protein